MISHPKYAFKKDSDELVHIDDVDNGSRCNCYCKTCGEDLVAKNQGSIKTHHFSHPPNSNCTSGETFLHFLAKMLITEMDEIYIPKIIFNNPNSNYGMVKLNIFKLNLPSVMISGTEFIEKFGIFGKIINVKVEKRLENIIPDLIVEIILDGQKIELILEVAVTHFIDEFKLNKIQNNNFNCIELSLKDLMKSKDLWNKDFILSALKDTSRYKLINQNIYKTDRLNNDFELETLKNNNGLIKWRYDKGLYLTDDLFKDSTQLEIFKNSLDADILNKIKIHDDLLESRLKFLEENFTENKIVYLDSKYEDREIVRFFGAKWNATVKKWFFQSNDKSVNIKKLLNWIDIEQFYQVTFQTPVKETLISKNSFYYIDLVGLSHDEKYGISNKWNLKLFTPNKSLWRYEKNSFILNNRLLLNYLSSETQKTINRVFKHENELSLQLEDDYDY